MLRKICKTPSDIALDYCHVFHLGMGMDCGASCIIMLAQLGHYDRHGGVGLPQRLNNAYQLYSLWCKNEKRTTSIKSFSREKFDMSGPGTFDCFWQIFIHDCIIFVMAFQK